MHRDPNTGDVELKIPSGRISKYKNDEVERIDYGVGGSKAKLGDSYIGISLGLSVPIGGSLNTATSGAYLNLLNCGMMLGGHVGLALNWFGAAYGSSSAPNEVPYTMGGFSFGLIFRGYLSENLQVDIRPMLGGGTFFVEYPGENRIELSMGTISIDAQFRYKMSDSFSFLASAGLLSAEITRTLNTFNLQAGLSYDF